MAVKEIINDEILKDDEPMSFFFEEALSAAKKLPSRASFVETGTRSGHSAILLLRAIKESGIRRWLFTIDPYGEKPYATGQIVSTTFDYGEQHYRNALHSLSKYSWENDLLHYHCRLRSQEFAKVQEQTEFWHGGSKVEPCYGFVYLDGEHALEPILKELEFFLPRLVSGGIIIIDDIGFIGEQLGELPIVGKEIHGRLFYQKP